MKNIFNILGLFVYEFIGNHVVNCLPIAYIRYFFYRFILKIKCDSTVYFQMGLYIYSSRGEIIIGKNTIINRNCVIDRRGGLEIGDNVNISPEVAIYTAGHRIDGKEFDGFKSKVVIGDRAWLGTRSMVIPGVQIGEGAVVLPGSVVTTNILPYTVVGGVPAKFVKKRSQGMTYNLYWRLWFM